MRIQNILIIGLTLFVWSCSDQNPKEAEISAIKQEINGKIDKIRVLNFGTFHMGFTTDLNQTEFDQNDKENKIAVQSVASKLAAFKPTVIIVEIEPQYNHQLQAEYASYKKNPDKFIKNPSEVELLAFELGRLSGTTRIYGIDHQMGYNYLIAKEIENEIDSSFPLILY